MIDADELKLWQALDAARGNVDRYNEIRNQLIELHYVLVQTTAKRVASRLKHSRVDVAELESAGVDGLIGSIENFDYRRGIKFRTFAARRVLGSIIDWQRSIDPNVRQFYSREEAIAGLAQQLGRRPNEYEILYHLAIADHSDRRASSIDEIRRGHAARDRQEFVRDSLRSQSRVVSLNDLSPLLKGLSQTERLIVVLYYVEECTMKQIAKELGLSESRISQCMSQILPRLRESYERAAA